MDENALSSREVGEYLLSIPTSLAIQSMAGTHPEQPTHSARFDQFDEFWVNLRTLYRNLIGSVHREQIRLLTPGGVAQALLDELRMLRGIVYDLSRGRVQLVTYVSNYEDLGTHYPHALLKQDSTPKQIEHAAFRDEALGILISAMEREGDIELHVFTRMIKPPRSGKTLIMTHYAFDLLSYRNFRELTLLESHTGNVKERTQWYTKYSGGNRMTPMPWDEGLLQIFGDSETFRPMANKLRSAVIEMAERCSWSALTTQAKIKFNIEQNTVNPWAKEVLLQILG